METKYKRIVTYVKESVQNHSLKPGGKLPSIREFCNDFQCNKATVIRAFEELQREHILYSIPKSGFYVVEKETAEKSQDDCLIDFSSASPNAELLPYAEFQHCVSQALTHYRDSILGYSDIRGFMGLRKVLRNQLADRQVFTDAENIFITSGAQQALYILSQLPFPNGKRNVLIEQPTYLGMKSALELSHTTTIGIARDASGFDLQELELTFRNNDIKFFYLMPRFQNPTGYSLTNEHKKRVLELAEKYDVFIVEDDYLADLETDSKTDAMYGLGFPHRVVYVKTFSKVLAPGLRICALVIPGVLANVFQKYKACMDYNTSTLSQGALEIYIRCGLYNSHIKKVQKFYSNQMKTFEAVCADNPSLLTPLHIPKTGFFACLRLPPRINGTDLANILSVKNIYLESVDRMFLPTHSSASLVRLSVCHVDKRQMQKGLNTIAETLQQVASDSHRIHFKKDQAFF